MLQITEPVRVTRIRSYSRKRDGKTINLLCYTPLDGSGGEHELSIPDDLNGGTPVVGEECSLLVESFLYPGVGHRQDGTAFGTWQEGRRLAGRVKPFSIELPQAA